MMVVDQWAMHLPEGRTDVNILCFEKLEKSHILHCSIRSFWLRKREVGQRKIYAI